MEKSNAESELSIGDRNPLASSDRGVILAAAAAVSKAAADSRINQESRRSCADIAGVGSLLRCLGNFDFFGSRASAVASAVAIGYTIGAPKAAARHWEHPRVGCSRWRNPRRDHATRATCS